MSMPHKALLLLLFFIGTSTTTFGQQEAADSTSLWKEAISRQAMLLIDSSAQVRWQAHLKLKEVLPEFLRDPGSWSFSFAELPTLSVQYPQDSSFRLITWQVETADHRYRHGGMLQFKAGKAGPVSLQDRPPEALFSEYVPTDAQDWFGGICYALYPFERANGQTAWLAFFYSSHSPYIARKWVDVLWFDESKKPRFGLPVFVKPDAFAGEDHLHRVLMEYFRGAATRFNYDRELGLIIKDHIIPYGMLPDRSGPAPVPDGSYEGFRYQNGKWMYEEKVFHHALQDGQAPRPFPKLDKEKKRDILGRKD